MHQMRLFEVDSTPKLTVFYGGRFQPMHIGHYQLYKDLVSKFGADNVFIATMFGKKQQQQHLIGEYGKDPFTFNEKKRIAMAMFDIPDSHIVNTSPYRPDITTVRRNQDGSAIVLAFSEKDAGRLQPSASMQPLPDDISKLRPASAGISYYITMPVNEGGMSATDFRESMASHDMSDDEKKATFKKFFGKFHPKVFNFIRKRLM